VECITAGFGVVPIPEIGSGYLRLDERSLHTVHLLAWLCGQADSIPDAFDLCM